MTRTKLAAAIYRDFLHKEPPFDGAEIETVEARFSELAHLSLAAADAFLEEIANAENHAMDAAVEKIDGDAPGDQASTS